MDLQHRIFDYLVKKKTLKCEHYGAGSALACMQGINNLITQQMQNDQLQMGKK